MNKIDAAAVLYEAAEAIRWKERALSLPNCYTCGKRKDCEYCPPAGDIIRINCPLWRLTKE